MNFKKLEFSLFTTSGYLLLILIPVHDQLLLYVHYMFWITLLGRKHYLYRKREFIRFHFYPGGKKEKKNLGRIGFVCQQLILRLHLYGL